MASDAFFVALILPNLLRRLFAEGAFNVAYVPLLTRIDETEGREKSQQFAASVAGVMAAILLVLTILAEIFMPAVVALLVPGYVDDAEKFTLTVLLGRITFPYLILITFASMLGAICNTLRHFAAFSFMPALLNVAFFVCLFALPPAGVDPARAAAWAVPLGGIFQLSFMVYALRKTSFSLRIQWNPKAAHVGELLRRLGPAALGVGVLQISFIIDTFLASYLDGQAISYLNYANRFYQLPLSMIGIAMATVLLPHFARELSKGRKQAASEAFTSAFTGGILLACAATIGLFVLAEEMLATLFEHGEFTAESARLTAWAMMAYSAGLPAYITTKITSSAFYAQGDTVTPVKASGISLAINFAANLTLMQFFGHIGIAMATAIAGYCNAGLQFYWLHKKDVLQIQISHLKMPLIKTFAISVVMAVVLWAYKAYVPYGDAFLWRFAWLVGSVSTGVILFVIGAQVSGLFDTRVLLRKVMSRA